MATVLGTFNRALYHLGETKLASTSETREATNVLGDLYDSAKNWCLTRGNWNFALKASAITSSGTASLGYTYRIPKPSDWMKTQAVSTDLQADSTTGPVDFRDENDAWHTNSSQLEVRYVSSTLGSTESNWTPAFEEVVSAWLAFQAAPKLSKSDRTQERVYKIYDMLLKESLQTDAFDEYAPLPAGGTWNSRVAIINDALRLLRQYKLVNEEAEKIARNNIESAFDTERLALLKAGYWNFALTASSLSQSGTATAGYQYRFQKPSDWVRTYEISSDLGAEKSPIDYRDEGGFWHTNVSPIEVRYVSTTKGLDKTYWTIDFVKALAARLAFAAAPPGADKDIRAELEKYADRVEKEALQIDALDEFPSLPAQGVWNSRTAIINGALRRMGMFRIADKNKERAARERIEAAYDGEVGYLLERAFWNFAMKTAQIAYDSSETASVGFTYAFEKPTDWIRTHKVSEDLSDDTGGNLLRYRDEGNYWHADITSIDVRYVSSDYGTDNDRWPMSFCNALSARLAEQCAHGLVSESKIAELHKDAKRAESEAKTTDAINEQVQFADHGRWVRARQGRQGHRSSGTRY